MNMSYANHKQSLEIAEKSMVSHAAVELLLVHGPGPRAIAAAYAASRSHQDDIESCLFWHDVMVRLEKIQNAIEGIDR